MRLSTLWLATINPLSATKIDLPPLATQVEKAAVIVVGRVERVTILDGANRSLADPSTRTGPGLNNELRLYVALDPQRIIKDEGPSKGLQIVLPLDKAWHNSLKEARDAYEKNTFIFFLSADLQPSNATQFFSLRLHRI